VVSLNAQVQDPSQKPVETTIRGNKLHGKKRQVAATEAVQPPKQTSPILSSSNEKRSQPDAIIAHAVSFLDCGYSLTEKYKDSMLVLRHSIHQNSWHNVNSTSRYSYRMYAFVNSDPEARCDKYTPWIQRMGYTPLLLPNPINLTAIDNQFFREQIDKTGVTGSSELIKLYLYTLTEHEIACHWDIDVIIKVSRTDFAGGYLVSHHRMLILCFSLFLPPVLLANRRNPWTICLMPCCTIRLRERERSHDPSYRFNNLFINVYLLRLMPTLPVTLL
jgi:hypothetical protein